MTDLSPTPEADPRLLRLLRTDLEGAGVTVEAVEHLLGPVAASAIHREDPVPARRRLAEVDGPLATFVRLFTLGLPVDPAEVDELLPTLGATGLLELGLARERSAGLCSTAEVRPYGDEEREWFVVSDHSELVLGGALPTDHVLGIGGASTTLARWTPRPQVRRALDLGTGCGVQALHLSTHADAIVATDTSPRALGYASVNAELASLALDLRAGSLLDPVAGERFDLVVSNPPFVLTPRTDEVPRYEYRDGGATGHAIVAGLVRDLGGVLEPGGIAQMLGNWEVRAGESWTGVVGAWLDAAERAGHPVDAWVIQRDVQDPAEYAATWSRDGGHRPGTSEHEAMVTAWLDDFASRGVERIGFGVITLQRPAEERATFRDLVEHTGPVASPMGPTILDGLRARTWLAGRTDAEVLDVAWRCAPDVTEERHGRPGADDPSVIVVRQGAGLRRAVRVDTFGAALVSVCDGELTAAQASAAITGLLGLDADEATAAAAALVRDLVADGLLVR